MPPIRRIVVVLAVVAVATLFTSVTTVVSQRKGGLPEEVRAFGDVGAEPRPGATSGDLTDSLAGAEMAPPPVGATLHPGLLSVTDARETPAGWIVLDGRSSRWHLLGEDGTLLRSVGRSGDGPGEMQNAVALALLGDTILVGERTRGTVERFHPDGRMMDRIVPGAPPGCPVAVLRQMAVTGEGLHLLRECVDTRTGSSTLQVHRWEGGGTPVVVAVRPWLDLTGAEPIRLGIPVLAGGGPLLLFGDAQSGCLTVLSPPERREEEVCHPQPPQVPLGTEELARIDAAVQRLSARGLTLERPRFRAPFNGVFLPRPGEVVFRTEREGNRFTLDPGPDSGGLGGGGLELEWSTPLVFLGAASLLVAGETIDGTWVMVLPRG